MLWDVSGQVKRRFFFLCAHCTGSSFHPGVTLPSCHDSGRLPLRLLLPKLTENWIHTLLHILTILVFTSKCSEFLLVQAFTMKLQYMCTFLNLLQVSVNQTGFSFSLWAQTFLRQTVICEYTHTVVAAFLFVLFWTLIFVVVIVKEWILLIYSTILSVLNHVPFFCLLYCYVNIFKMICTLCVILHLFCDISVIFYFILEPNVGRADVIKDKSANT